MDDGSDVFAPDDWDDTTDFYKVVNDDTEMLENAAALEHPGESSAAMIDFENEQSSLTA